MKWPAFSDTNPAIRWPSAGIFFAAHKQYLIGFCLFWIAIALFEFGQDYISALLNDNAFILAESVSYKLFWPLFIPFSIALDYAMARGLRSGSRPGWGYAAYTAIITAVLSLVHLLLFSVILYGISNLIHHNPMSLMVLLFEKLSTRLYIALAIYVTLAVAHVFITRRWRRREAEQQEQEKVPTTITVKNGKRSVIVDVADICWIGSDGAYLDIHTAEQKHVVLDSLKKIITQLPGNFKRIHRSTIVNTNCIAELRSRGNGDYDVILNDGRELRLSRNYAKPLKGDLL